MAMLISVPGQVLLTPSQPAVMWRQLTSTRLCEAIVGLHTCKHEPPGSCFNLCSGCCLSASKISPCKLRSRAITASHTVCRERAALAAARKEEAAKRVAAMTTEEALAFRAECRKKREVSGLASVLHDYSDTFWLLLFQQMLHAKVGCNVAQPGYSGENTCGHCSNG